MRTMSRMGLGIDGGDDWGRKRKKTPLTPCGLGSRTSSGIILATPLGLGFAGPGAALVAAFVLGGPPLAGRIRWRLPEASLPWWGEPGRPPREPGRQAYF